jgi:hypothetical protein
MITHHSAEICVRRYDGVPECDVVVSFRGHAMTLRCRDYDQAVEWARIECKAYKVAGGFTVEHQPNQTIRQRPTQGQMRGFGLADAQTMDRSRRPPLERKVGQ